jgi:homoaconitase/3-isopropylmalate dehydratase large subunit
MTKAQSAITFCAELKSLGIAIPDNTTEINISLATDKPAVLWFRVANIDTMTVKKIKGKLPRGISSKDFYNSLKKTVKLPNEATSISIKASLDNIVMMTIEAALPQNSLGFLKA